jgi:uncharacterized protein (UPF0332 family)
VDADVTPSDFLKTAEELIESEGGRPRQANLRRASSSIYYALFHTLCLTCARMLIGQQDTKRAWNHVYRAVQHKDANDNCRRTEMIERFPVAIQDFALMFSQMQEKRHRADYDPDHRLTKSEVATDIVAARAAMAAFHRVHARHRRAFAAYILLGKPRP